MNYKIDDSGQMYIPEVTEDEIILYTTGCPKCKVLESKLQSKGISYTKNTSIDEMYRLEFVTTPMLKVGDKYLDFGSAVKWINNKGSNNNES